MANNAVEVEDLSKRFRMYRERNQSLKAAVMRGKRAEYREFWALKHVTFDIPAGSTFGLIGENGSGKSTLLKCITRILRPDTGVVRANGSMAAMLELGSGFHPELSGRENVYLNGSILGMRKSEIDEKFEQIVDFSGVREFIDQPVKNYSSGMYVRLGFSVAINIDPDILLVDEVLAVGDANFQDKCMEKFADFRKAGKTVIIVSHAMSSLRSLCDEAAWLKHGELLEAGDATQIVDTYSEASFAERAMEETGDDAHEGSGEVQIIGVELLDTAGVARHQVRTDDEVCLRINYDATEPVDKPVFALAIETSSGVYVWTHHSRDGGYVPDRICGPGSVDLRIPSLHLQAGAYTVRARILDYTLSHTYDFRPVAHRFDVTSKRPHESGGIVALDSTWPRETDAP
jgi:ABC-type polysaccharide/polyol phosphate transport system ATPase subunit